MIDFKSSGSTPFSFRFHPWLRFWDDRYSYGHFFHSETFCFAWMYRHYLLRQSEWTIFLPVFLGRAAFDGTEDLTKVAQGAKTELFCNLSGTCGR